MTQPTDRHEPRRRFILYDGRAKSGNTDDAAVIVCVDSEREVRSYRDMLLDYDGIWYEYDMMNGKAANERRRDDLGEPR